MKLVLVLLALLLAAPLHAATLYVKAAGGNWTDASTWSATDSSGMDDAGPPGSTDTAIFEAGSGNVVVDAIVNVGTVSMTGGTGDYAGVLSVSDDTDRITLNRSSNGVVWVASSASTIDMANARILIQPCSCTRTFTGADKNYPRVSAFSLGTGVTVNFTGANTFQSLTLDNAGGTLAVTFEAGTTTTLGDLITANNTRMYISSSSAGMPATISKANGVVSVSNLTLTDITATGGATWCGDTMSDGGGNTGWNFDLCPVESKQLLTGVR